MTTDRGEGIRLSEEERAALVDSLNSLYMNGGVVVDPNKLSALCKAARRVLAEQEPAERPHMDELRGAVMHSEIKTDDASAIDGILVACAEFMRNMDDDNRGEHRQEIAATLLLTLRKLVRE